MLKYCWLNVGARVAPSRVADTIQQIFIKTRGLTICNADSHAAGVRYELAETFPLSTVALVHPFLPEYSFTVLYCVLFLELHPKFLGIFFSLVFGSSS